MRSTAPGPPGCSNEAVTGRDPPAATAVNEPAGSEPQAIWTAVSSTAQTASGDAGKGSLGWGNLETAEGSGSADRGSFGTDERSTSNDGAEPQRLSVLERCVDLLTLEDLGQCLLTLRHRVRCKELVRGLGVARLGEPRDALDHPNDR